MATSTIRKDYQSDIDSLNSNMTVIETTTNPATGRTLSVNIVRKLLRNIEVVIKCNSITPSSTGWINIATLPAGANYRPNETLDFIAVNNADDSAVHARIENAVIMVYGRASVAIAPIILVNFVSAE